MLEEGAGSRLHKTGYPQSSRSLAVKRGSVVAIDKYVDTADRVEATVEVSAPFIHPCRFFFFFKNSLFVVLSGTEAKIKNTLKRWLHKSI